MRKICSAIFVLFLLTSTAFGHPNTNPSNTFGEAIVHYHGELTKKSLYDVNNALVNEYGCDSADFEVNDTLRECSSVCSMHWRRCDAAIREHGGSGQGH